MTTSRFRMAWLLQLLALTACASAQITTSGTLETYFRTQKGIRGAYEPMSWTELGIRVGTSVKSTLSFTQFAQRRMVDEAYVAYERGNQAIRAGRIRTSFGFSDWSELYYNGFNRLPLTRSTALVEKLRLMRDDAGLEHTAVSGNWQLQSAVVDTLLSDAQIQPSRFRYGVVRLQHASGPLIAALDSMTDLRGNRRILGVDLRWTTPHWLVRAEGMRGFGGQTEAAGAYLDAAYRIPRLPRTQAVARFETFADAKGGTTRLNTLGARQVFHRSDLPGTISINLNYTWGQNSRALANATDTMYGWTVRTMFQLTF